MCYPFKIFSTILPIPTAYFPANLAFIGTFFTKLWNFSQMCVLNFDEFKTRNTKEIKINFIQGFLPTKKILYMTQQKKFYLFKDRTIFLHFRSSLFHSFFPRHKETQEHEIVVPVPGSVKQHVYPVRRMKLDQNAVQQRT